MTSLRRSLIIRLLVCPWLSLCLAVSAAAQSKIKSIPEIELPRYMGSWYEIAKFPNWFQRKCTHGTQATYKILEPQKIEVLNRCGTQSGEFIQALGLARPQKSGLPAQLEVRFAPEWLGWLPFVWGTYWVLDLDPDYQLAAVGDPSKNYLWILSRTTQVTPANYEALVQRLALMGFDITKLEKTSQN